MSITPQDQANIVLDKLFTMRLLIQASIEPGATTAKFSVEDSDSFAPRELERWLKQLQPKEKEEYDKIIGSFWQEVASTLSILSTTSFMDPGTEKDIKRALDAIPDRKEKKAVLETLAEKYPLLAEYLKIPIEQFKRMFEIESGQGIFSRFIEKLKKKIRRSQEGKEGTWCSDIQ